ncbi:hypothetical protein P3342_006588 [Pyrenophora teres f. teres]|nr:hypothetical protein P3342_006588 [Pyrenophora teres f. teres]
MHPPIPTPLWPPPSLQHRLIQNLHHFHPNWPTSTLHPLIPLPILLLSLVPPPPTQVTTRARTQCTKQILFRKESNITILRRRTGFHKVSSLRVQPSDLKHVEHVVDVVFREAVREDGANEVGVAVVVVGC